jgi:DNA-binding protein H-NS
MTKKTLAQIQSQIDKLQKEAESIRAREVSDVVGRIKEAIAHYGLSAADLGLDGKTAARGPVRKGAASAEKVSAKARKKAVAQAPAKKSGRKAAADKTATGKPAKAARVSVIKFADDQGHTWTGVGKRPNWFLAAIAAGKTADELRVNAAS